MVDAMAKNEILQIVVMSIFVGVAITAVGEKAAPLVKAIDALVHVMLQVTDYVMRVAPLAVFAAVAGTLTERGPGVIGQLAYFMGSFYLTLLILWAVLLTLGFLFIRACWRRSTDSACRRASPASSCRSAIRSISTAR